MCLVSRQTLKSLNTITGKFVLKVILIYNVSESYLYIFIRPSLKGGLYMSASQKKLCLSVCLSVCSLSVCSDQSLRSGSLADPALLWGWEIKQMTDEG